MSKPRIVKAYNKLDESIKSQLIEKYPYGFEKHLITFKNHKGKFVSALPFEDDDYNYLIRMTIAQAQKIVLGEQIPEEEPKVEPKKKPAKSRKRKS